MTLGTSARIASSTSTDLETSAAVGEAVARVSEGLQGARPDLVCVFCSPHHLPSCEVIPTILAEHLGPRNLVGCSGESIAGDGREIEDGPAMAVWAAHLPGASLSCFHSTFVTTERGQGFSGLPEAIEGARAVLLIADPFSYPADALLGAAATQLGGVPFVGGMASGGSGPGQHRLFHGDHVHDSGAVGVVIGGDVSIRTIVSQGCRPIGDPFVVTISDGNVIRELGGRRALDRLMEMVDGLSESDRELASRGLHVGVVIDEQKEDFGRGDFLIRAVMGVDEDSGSLAVGEQVEVGRTIQFHVRDAASADADLRELLTTVDGDVSGALLFTCNGRGSRMFPAPDHDIGAIRERMGDIPVAGFFCQGEIGPIGPRSFLHGFTASAAFFG